MMDIVEQLQEAKAALYDVMVAEIERLTAELDLERRRLKTSESLRTGLVAELERLRAALRAILDDPEIGTNVALYAKTALEGKENTE
jgi:uncharacterized membrane protein YccC